ncbi:MAG: YdcF family protein [Limnohabitans sp.]
MESLLFLKPILTNLILPAALAPLLTLLLSVWAWQRAPKQARVRVPLCMSMLCSVGFWFISCPAVAVWLSTNALPPVPVTTPQALQQQDVQAIVVLGGGLDLQAQEYGAPNLSNASMSRLLYGLYLAQHTQLPMAFSGGKGWGSSDTPATEAGVANAVLKRLHAPALRWQEDASRDTFENARFTAELLKRDGIERIALVTHAWHMPRSLRHFEATGLSVVPAPMGFIRTSATPVLQWIPQAGALQDSSTVIKEWLGNRLM